MEQAPLDRLDAAPVSIDGTPYDFNRVAFREAPIAAHHRGVTVRVVTDDEAYSDPGYAQAACNHLGIDFSVKQFR